MLYYFQFFIFLDCTIPPEFSQGSDGNAYYLSDTKKHFDEAKGFCSEKDSVLAYFKNENEILAIYQLLPDPESDDHREIWIGIKPKHDNDGEQYFTWIETNENIPANDHIQFEFKDDKERCCARVKKRKQHQNKIIIRETDDHKKRFMCQKRCATTCKIFNLSFTKS